MLVNPKAVMFLSKMRWCSVFDSYTVISLHTLARDKHKEPEPPPASTILEWAFIPVFANIQPISLGSISWGPRCILSHKSVNCDSSTKNSLPLLDVTISLVDCRSLLLITPEEVWKSSFVFLTRYFFPVSFSMIIFAILWFGMINYLKLPLLDNSYDLCQRKKDVPFQAG